MKKANDDIESIYLILKDHKKAIDDLYKKINQIIKINNRNGANIAECMNEVFNRIISLEPNKPH